MRLAWPSSWPLQASWPAGESACLLHTGADTLETLAVYLGMLGADVEVAEPPELVAHLRDLVDRYRRATR
jgi:hypothetical protein